MGAAGSRAAAAGRRFRRGRPVWPRGSRTGVQDVRHEGESMRAAFLLALVAGQAVGGTPQALVTEVRRLEPAEIARVLAAARTAVAGRTVRLAFVPDGPGPDILFGSDGRRRIIRSVSGISGGLVSGDGSSSTFHTTVETITDY